MGAAGIAGRPDRSLRRAGVKSASPAVLGRWLRQRDEGRKVEIGTNGEQHPRIEQRGRAVDDDRAGRAHICTDGIVRGKF